MNCLAQRKKFKNKHPAWLDPSDPRFDGTQDQDKEVEGEVEAKGSSDDEEDDLDMYAGDVRSKKIKLETKELIYKHLLDINNDRSFKGAVQQVQFNPKSKVALVALRSGQLDLFEVDGERNRYIQNIKLPRTKEPYCSFKPDGDSIVISSNTYKGTFYVYDMIEGSVKSYTLKDGILSKGITDFVLNESYMACREETSQEVSILSTKTYENTYSFHINEPVKALQFSSDNELFAAGEDASIYVWDLRKTSVCKHKFQDEGSVHTTSLAISRASQTISVGSDSGIVNSYRLEQCLATKYPTPDYTFSNLKTQTDMLKYNYSGELLLINSRAEPGAFRMIHTLSGTVYKNFPKQGKKYHHLLTADFSPLSGHLALGCSTGRAYLCRIPYYLSY